jgi:hypothetical protein
MKNSIEFELKDLKKVLAQKKSCIVISSPTYKYGEFDWAIKSRVEKCIKRNDGKILFTIGLKCASVNQANFPVFVYMKFFILNKDKNLSKDFSNGNLLKF